MTGQQEYLSNPRILTSVREAMQHQPSHRVETALPDFLQDKLDRLDELDLGGAERPAEKQPHRHG